MRGTRGLDHPPCSQWNSDYRLSRVKTGHQVCLLPSPDPSLSPYTCLSLEWALIRLQAGRLEECTMRTGVAQRYRYVLYTHHQANLTVVSCSTVRLSHSLANPRGSLNTRAVFMGGGVWVETAAEIMTKKFCMCPSVSVQWLFNADVFMQTFDS